jgi:hypothetical protein
MARSENIGLLDQPHTSYYLEDVSPESRAIMEVFLHEIRIQFESIRESLLTTLKQGFYFRIDVRRSDASAKGEWVNTEVFVRSEPANPVLLDIAGLSDGDDLADYISSISAI